MNYKELGEFLVENVGGRDNILSVTHCMTRLRFDLKNDQIANDEIIKNHDDIITVVKSAGQYQVVIGQNVAKVYNEINSIINGAKSDYKVGYGGKENKEKNQNLFSKLISTIVGIIGPLLPILIGAGLGRAILALIVQMGLVDTKISLTYKIFNMVFDTGFTFLPVFVAVSASKHFKTNTYLAALMGLSLVHPVWNGSVDVLNPQFIGNLFGILPVYGMSYTSSIIPSILIVWVMSKIEKLLNDKLPELIRPTFGPLLLLVIMTPLTFVLIAPVMGVFSNLLGNGLIWFFNTFGGVGMVIMGLIYPWMVATGTHSTLAVGGIQILTQNGYDPISRTLTLGANMAQGGAAFAASLKTKDKKLKSMGMSAGATALIAGITEPALYTVSLKYKNVMYAVMAGSAAGSLFAGILGLKAFAFMTPSIINFPMWIGQTQSNNLLIAIITMIISFSTSFLITYFMKIEGIDYNRVEE